MRMEIALFEGWKIGAKSVRRAPFGPSNPQIPRRRCLLEQISENPQLDNPRCRLLPLALRLWVLIQSRWLARSGTYVRLSGLPKSNLPINHLQNMLGMSLRKTQTFPCSKWVVAATVSNNDWCLISVDFFTLSILFKDITRVNIYSKLKWVVEILRRWSLQRDIKPAKETTI